MTHHRAASSDRIITRDFGLLTLAHMMQALGFSSMVLLPVFMDQLGADRAEIGLVMGLAATGSLALRPLVAWALDTIGRHPTLYLGTVVLGAGMMSFGAITEMGVGIYAARVLTGVGTGTLFAGYFAAASDLIPAARRTQGIALFGISGLAPLMVGPLAREAGVAAQDIGLFFASLGALILLSVVPLRFVRPPTPSPRPKLSWSAAVRALHAPSVRPVWLATAGLSALVAAFFAFSTVTAESRDAEHPALLWVMYAVGAAAVRLLFAFQPNQIPPRRLVPPALIAYAGATLLAAVAESDVAFATAGLLAGLGHGVGFPAFVSQVASRMPDYLRGSGMAAFTALWESVSLCVTPILGWLADRTSDAWMFTTCAGIAIVTLVLWLPLEKKYGPPGEVG